MSVRAEFRVTAVCLALLAFTPTVGCSRLDAPRAAPAVHELRIADLHEPASLDPLVAFTQSDIAYDQLFCQTLVRAGGPKRVIAQLVTRVPSRENGDISADGKRITYHLRRDVRFADGVPFTSRDVAFTYRAIFDPRNHAASVEEYRRVAALRTPDPFTVTIALRQPWNAAVGTVFAAAAFAYGVLPAHAFTGTAVTGSAWEQRAFGTGPFRVIEWEHGDRIVLERNPYFVPRPRLDRIVLRIIPNSATARIALLTGAVDIAPLLPVDVSDMRRRSGIHVVINYLNGFTALTMHVTRPPTDDPHVRRAIADALDLAALAKINFDLGRPVRSFLAPPIVTWKQQPAQAAYAHDPAAASRELDAAGWRMARGARRKNGRTLSLTYAANADDASDVRRAVAIAAQLAGVGIPVDIKSYSTALYDAPDGALRGGKFNLASGSEIAGDDPEQSVVTTCAQANGAANYGRYCRPAFDSLFADQATTRSVARRYRDFDAMERMVIDDVALVPLFQYMFIVGVADRVMNYRTDYLEFPIAPQTWDVAG
jgi:peptide/nickel transport system substrate-binding protein